MSAPVTTKPSPLADAVLALLRQHVPTPKTTVEFWPPPPAHRTAPPPPRISLHDPHANATVLRRAYERGELSDEDANRVRRALSIALANGIAREVGAQWGVTQQRVRQLRNKWCTTDELRDHATWSAWQRVDSQLPPLEEYLRKSAANTARRERIEWEIKVAETPGTQEEVARRYGLAQSHVSQLRRRRLYGPHLPRGRGGRKVPESMARHIAGEQGSQKEVAARFGISYGAVANYRKQYRHWVKTEAEIKGITRRGVAERIDGFRIASATGRLLDVAHEFGVSHSVVRRYRRLYQFGPPEPPHIRNARTWERRREMDALRRERE